MQQAFPPNAKRVAGRLDWAVGSSLLAAALAIFYFTVLSISPETTIQNTLTPWPDGPEYVDSARNFVGTGSFRIHVGGEEHPSRYPPGYSALVAAALLAGVDPIWAPYLVNQWAAFLLLAVLSWFLIRRGKVLEAGLSALLISVLPIFVVLCRSPMSEIASALSTVPAVLFLVKYSEGQGVRWGRWGAFILGLSLCIRLSNLFFVPFIAAAVAALHGRNWRVGMKDGFQLGGFLAAGAIPLLLFNTVVLGGPLRTGYGYWLAGYGSLIEVFKLGNALDWLSFLRAELLQEASFARIEGQVGEGSGIGPAYVLLLLIAPLGMRRDRRFFLFSGAALLYLIGFAVYPFVGMRFLFPLIALAAPAAAVGSVRILRGLLGARRWITAAPLLLLLTASVLGWPGQRSDTELGDMLKPRRIYWSPPYYEMVTRFDESVQPGPKLVLTDLLATYVHAIIDAESMVAPLSDDHGYRYNPERFVFDGRTRTALISKSLSEGRPVYALLAKPGLDRLELICPAPDGFRWEVEFRTTDGRGIARLLEE